MNDYADKSWLWRSPLYRLANAIFWSVRALWWDYTRLPRKLKQAARRALPAGIQFTLQDGLLYVNPSPISFSK